MNAYSRTMPLSGAARPVREHGSSALDRPVVTWSAPDPSARVFDAWGAPKGPAVAPIGFAPWPAPDPVMRFELPAPIALSAPSTDLVEPTHSVPVPDLVSASLSALAPLPPPVPAALQQLSLIEPLRPGWPAPTLADAAPVAPIVAPAPDRSGISTRLVIGLAVAAGAFAAGAAALLSVL